MNGATSRDDALGPSTPCSLPDIIVLGHHLSLSLIACFLNRDMRNRCDVVELQTAVAANTTAFVELKSFLTQQDQQNAKDTPIITDEGRRSVMALAETSRELYHIIIAVLLKGSTVEDPDETGDLEISKIAGSNVLGEATRIGISSTATVTGN